MSWLDWDFIQLSPQFLEAINGVLIIILMAIEIVFLDYIIRQALKEVEIHLSFHKGNPWKGIWSGLLYAYQTRKAAISCFIFFFGDMVIRVAIWSYRHLQNNGHKPPEKFATIVTTIGVGICIVGGVCILRHFAPRENTTWAILVMVFTSLLFGIGLAL